ncbi:DUF6221 family protein [Streptomyces sp. NPDC018947]|uniref:DUF6221 family protein n=1 Tax=Streptomyces sp. NPDC018947 TaxID=3365054 RepID=UPI0037B61D29
MDQDWQYQPDDELGGTVVSTRGADILYGVTTGVGEHVAEHDPRRVLREVRNDRETLRQYERLLRSRARNSEAEAELTAEIEHQERTGRWDGPGDPGCRGRAPRREADCLPAMPAIMDAWAGRKAAVYMDRPGYHEDWWP